MLRYLREVMAGKTHNRQLLVMQMPVEVKLAMLRNTGLMFD